MSIRYIQSNYGKLNCQNVLKFLFDVMIVNIEDVQPYVKGTKYKKGDCVHLKENGIHKVYRCKVDVSSDIFVPDEWEHVMDIYDEEVKSPKIIGLSINQGYLSGGEKVRCVLSKLMLSGANFLIFDEPTNHLDMESITALNEGMNRFKGNMIFTSHDHQLTQTVANRILDIKTTGLVDREVTYNEYLGLE